MVERMSTVGVMDGGKMQDGRARVFDEPTPDLWLWGDIVQAVGAGTSRDAVARHYGCSVATIDRIVHLKRGPR